MLTWINEKAKWIIVIFAAGIVVGLLAMDRVPNTAQSYPVVVVNDDKVSYKDFDNRIKMIIQNKYQGQHLEDEQYAQLRSEVLHSFVRQLLMTEQYNKAELAASVAELKGEFKNNTDAVRSRLVQEAQSRLYMIQQQATSQEDLMQRSQAYIASLPKFLVDSTFDKAEYDAWLETPEAFQWGMMLQYEEDLKTSLIPSRQLQLLVGASVHPTSLEAAWDVKRRMTDYEMEIAFASNNDFSSESEIDSAMVKGYFNAHVDSFYVENDKAKFQYASLAIAPTAADEERIREYAMTIYYQLSDTASAANFEDMARISSEDPGSAEQGGKLNQVAGKGVFVKEFEEAALALDSGAISEPVKSPFGYHIIKSYGKTTDSTGAVTADVGHILLMVTASSETIDSLEKVLIGIKNDTETGKTFVDAAKERNIEVSESEWIGHDDNISALGYMRGLASYAWPNENLPKESDVSPILKNAKYVAVFTKVDELKAGSRNLNPYFASIKKSLATKKSSSAAAAYLSSVSEKVKTWAPADSADTTRSNEIEKVIIQSINSSVDGFIPGFGYANVNVAKVLENQKVGEWGPVVETEQGAVMIKVLAKKVPDESAVETAIKDELSNTNRYTAATLFNQFVTNIEKGTPIENNLDLFYKD